MNKDKIIEAMAKAISNAVHSVDWETLKEQSPITAQTEVVRAEAAFQALLTELPDWHTLHKNNRSKSIINTIAAIGVSYQELLNMRDNT